MMDREMWETIFCVTNRLLFYQARICLSLLFSLQSVILASVQPYTHTIWPRQFPPHRLPRCPPSPSSNHRHHFTIASPAGPRSTRLLSTPSPVSPWLPPVPESTTTHLNPLLLRRKTLKLPPRRRRLAKRTRRQRRTHRKSRSLPLPHPRQSLKVCTAKPGPSVLSIADPPNQKSPKRQPYRARMTCPK
jgi:hypothetical protein